MVATNAIEAYRCGACETIFEEPEGPVYECSRCNGTQIDERRCPECHIFMAKVADSSCPACEDGEAITEVEAFSSADGDLHLSAEEAAAWDADAPERAAEQVRHKEKMDAYLDSWSEERRAVCAALLPRMRLLLAALPEGAVPELHQTVALTVESMERDPTGFSIYTMMVGLDDLGRLLLPGDETEALIATGRDYGLSYDDREIASGRMLERLRPLLVPEVLERFDDHFSGFGTRHGFDVADVLFEQFGIEDPS